VQQLAAGWLPGEAGRGDESAGLYSGEIRRGFWRGKQTARKEGSTAPGRLWREEDDGKGRLG